MKNLRPADRITTYIASSGYKIGDRLPSEAEMVDILGLSRNTIREAYAKLSARGILLRKHGVGTFLSKPKIMNDFDKQRGFWEFIEEAGYEPSLEIRSIENSTKRTQISDMLMPVPDGPVVHMDWVFKADDEPVVYIRHAISPVISVYGIDWSKARNLVIELQDRFNPHNAEIEVTNTAENASPEVAEILNLSPGTAVHYSHARIFLADGTVPIVSCSWSNSSISSVTRRQPLFVSD